MKVTINPFTNNNQVTAIGLTIGDVYQTADYGIADAKLISGECNIIQITGDGLNMVIPVIIREINLPNGTYQSYYDITSAYGYPGYYANRAIELHEIDKIISSIKAVARQAQIVSIFLRLNPILNHQIWPNNAGIAQIFHGKTVFLDLTENLDAIRSEYSTNHKRDLKKLKQSDCKVHFNLWDHYESFINVYTETMTMANARKYYFFNSEYFEQLRKINDTQLHLISVTNLENTVIAGAIFFETNGIVQYHLGGTKNAFRNIASSKLIFDAAIEFFKQRGNAVLHLGGGYGSTEDELFRFKSGFSNHTLTFSTLRIITDEAVYRLLAKSKSTENSNNFFPLYRK